MSRLELDGIANLESRIRNLESGRSSRSITRSVGVNHSDGWLATMLHARRPGPSRDSLEYRQCRTHVHGRRGDVARHRAAGILTGRASGQARRARLLGACGPARLARLAVVRTGAADARRALFFLDARDEDAVGCPAWESGRRGAGVRPRNGRPAGGSPRTL